MTKIRVFLSYARADDDPNYDNASKSFMRRLYNGLTQAGFDVWWDRESMPSRDEVFTKEIEKAIAQQDRFLLVVGPNIHKPDGVENYVRAEWECALSFCKPITPILFKGDFSLIPEHSRNKHAVDFRDQNRFTERLAELDRILRDEVQPPGKTYGVDFVPVGFINRDVPYNAVRNSLLQDQIQATVVSAAIQTATSVYGPGGVGKSTLALAIGRDFDIRRRFSDGVIWVKVGQKTTPTQLQSSIGVTVYKDSPENYKNERDGWLALSYLLKDKKTLIILDDVWDHELVKHLPVADTNCRLLITTRSATLAANVEGLDVRLDVLTPEEGARLIAARVGGGEQPIYLQISQELNGHTLAVVLAAARLKKRGINYAQTILDGLKDTLNPFLHLAVDPQDKDLNLSKSLALSYEALNPKQQKQFRSLGIFAVDSTFPLEALTALWDENPANADLQAEALCDACLLDHNPDTGRYSQHRVLRAHARALLAEAGELDDVQRRHFTFYEARHTEYGKDYQNQRENITADLENLREALIWGFTYETQSACNFLAHLDNYYLLYNPILYRPLLETALNAVAHIEYELGRANILRSLGDLEMYEDNLISAQEAYDQALSIFMVIKEQIGQANTLKALGDLAVRKGDLFIARRQYNQALSIFENIDEPLGQSNTLKALGDLELQEAKFASARLAYERALSICKTIGAKLGQANTLKALGDLAVRENDLVAARVAYREARPIYETIGARLGQANTLLALGDLAVREANLAAALKDYERAWHIFEAIGDRLGQANTLKALGDLEAWKGNLAPANELYTKALNLYQIFNDQVGLMNIYVNMGRLYRKNGDLEQAKIYFQKWFEIVNTLPAYKDHPETHKIMRQYQALISGSPEPAPHLSFDDVIHRLKPLYDQIGADALREGLLQQPGASPEVVEDILAKLAAM